MLPEAAEELMPAGEPIPSVARDASGKAPAPVALLPVQFSVPLTVRLVVTATLAPSETVAPLFTVVAPPRVIAPDPETFWFAEPLKFTAWPAGKERAAPLSARSPATLSAPVMVLESVTPEFRRRLPRTVSALPPETV